MWHWSWRPTDTVEGCLAIEIRLHWSGLFTRTQPSKWRRTPILGLRQQHQHGESERKSLGGGRERATSFKHTRMGGLLGTLVRVASLHACKLRKAALKPPRSWRHAGLSWRKPNQRAPSRLSRDVWSMYTLATFKLFCYRHPVPAPPYRSCAYW